MKLLCRIFEKPVTFHEVSEGLIALTVDPQMIPCTKYIATKYNPLWSFIAKSDVGIKHVDNKEHTTDVFMKPLYLKLFGYLR